MIELQHVTLRRGTAEVIRDISLHLPGGQITVVVGRSGVGKSTLLGALNGLHPLAAGRIGVAGIGPLVTAEAIRRHQQQTATIFQDHALIDRLSALDNVLLGLADQRHPLSPLSWPDACLQQAADALAQVGLLPRALVRVDRLSGGEKQRVGIARALIRHPRLLLGDEPFASVDPALLRQLGDTLRRQVTERGVTVVLVMHQIEAALTIADRIVALVDGRVAFSGASRDFDAGAQAGVFGNVDRCSPMFTAGHAAACIGEPKEGIARRCS